MSKSPEYVVWGSMLKRCYNPRTRGFENYGGRGIIVEPEWHKFEQFFADMGHRPPFRTLDRKDVNGNYCAENCIWSTRAAQAQNKRNVHRLTHDGQTLTLRQWEKMIGVPYATLYQRHRKGWPPERVLCTDYSET